MQPIRRAEENGLNLFVMMQGASGMSMMKHELCDRNEQYKYWREKNDGVVSRLFSPLW
jgi:hypothetical protein